MDPNPWLTIPADDYEAHMSTIGQSAALRGLFSLLYRERRPTRLAVLGCTTGADLQQVDPADTEIAVGVDINSDYLAIARRRSSALGTRLQLVQGDVLRVDLPPGRFDLVHAALLLEYVDPTAFFRRVPGWLAPDGTCSVVTQDPTPGVAAVSPTGYGSLQALAGRMSLREPEEIATLAGQAGLRLVFKRTVPLPSGKSLTNSIFAAAGTR